MNERLEKLKKFLDENCYSSFDEDKMQTFFTRNIVGDRMTNIYDVDNIQVDVSYYYDYIEIFGLSDDEKEELRKYGYNERLK